MTAAEDGLIPDPRRPGAYVVRVGGAMQSYVDPADPLHIEFEYTGRIADLLDAWAPPLERLRVVHIGGAGMTLPRYVAATRPTSAQVVLEPDVALTQRVRETIPLPQRSGIKVRDVEGRAGLAAMRSAYADVVVVDAFADGRVPAHLTTAEFFDELRRVVADDGVAVLNVTDRGPFDYGRRVAAGLLDRVGAVAITTEPAIFKGRRFGNLVLIASAAILPIAVLQRRGAGATFPYRVLHGADLHRWIAGARPFTDADSRESPEFVRGLVG